MKSPPRPFSLGLALALSGPFAPRAAEPKKPATSVRVVLTLKGTITEEPAPMGLDGQPVSDKLAGVVGETPTGATLVMVQAEFLASSAGNPVPPAGGSATAGPPRSTS